MQKVSFMEQLQLSLHISLSMLAPQGCFAFACYNIYVAVLSFDDQSLAHVPQCEQRIADSEAEAEQASEESEKSLQERAKEGAGRMTNSIQEAYDDIKAKANS